MTNKINTGAVKAVPLATGYSMALLGMLFVPLKSHADMAQGTAWLQANLGTSSMMAADVQAVAESVSTLGKLGAATGNIDINALLQDEHSTEILSRVALVASLRGQSPAVYFAELKASQNADGGFGHLEGWQSNPLDTAFVLLALSETQFMQSLNSATEKQQWQDIQYKALGYLRSQQRADGSYQVLSLDKLYVSAYVLNALSKGTSARSDLNTVISTLVAYLEQSRNGAAQWSSNSQGLFIDALVTEALHPFHNAKNQSIEAAFTQRAYALQSANGSWQADPYTSAVVLRTLKNISSVATNPITSTLRVQVIDAETRLPLPNVLLTEDGVASTLATSEVNGNVELLDYTAGRHKFSLKRAGYAAVTFDIIMQQGQTSGIGQISLKRLSATSTTQIQGTVLDAATGTPVAGARVTVVLVDSQGQPLPDVPAQIVYSAGNGAYQLVLPQDGYYGIDIRQTGYVPVQSNGNARLGTTTLYNARLLGSTGNLGIVTGRVVDQAGQPLVSAQVTNGAGISATTDSSGLFRLTGIVPGNTRWTVIKSGFYSSAFTASVGQGQQFDAGSIVLKAGQDNAATPDVGQLTVNVTESIRGLSLSGASIIAERLNDQGQVLQTQSYSSSVASSSLQLGAGQWRISVSHAGYQTTSQTIQISAGSAESYAAVLVPVPYTVKAQVVDAASQQPLKNVPFDIVDVTSGDVIYSGQTDGSGNLMGVPNLVSAVIRLEFKPATHLGTSQVIYRDFLSDPVVNLGQVRLREKSSDDDLIKPDLVVSNIDVSAVSEDPLSLAITGNLGVTVANQGRISATVYQPVEAKAFIDKNLNRQYDYGETVLGSVQLGTVLDNLSSKTVQIPVQGTLDFRNAPIAVAVDSTQLVDELKEDNNVALSSDFRTLAKVGVLDPYRAYSWSFRGKSQTSFFSIAPLRDTNGDGKVGVGDRAAVLVSDRDFKGGRCCVTLRGIEFGAATPQIIFESMVTGRANAPVVADIDADGRPEVFSQDGDWGPNSDAGLPIADKDYVSETVRFFDAGGQFLRKIAANKTQLSAVAIADVNHNKQPVIFERTTPTYSDRNGQRFMPYVDYNNNTWGEYGRPVSGYVPALDDIAWLTASSMRTLYQGANFVVDMDRDGIPEIFELSGYSQKQGVIARNFTTLAGKGYYGYNQFSLAYGASLNVAIDDLDGDGKPEVVYGTQENELVAFKNDGTLLWKLDASNFTGSYAPGPYDTATSAGVTVFDLDGDGQKEVITGNDRGLTIVNAKTGAIVARALTDAPIDSEGVQPWSRLKVADIDADGHADIVYNTGYRIVVFSSQSKSWAGARNIWNNETYHITDINDDLTVPQYDRPWESHNTAGVQKSYGVPQEPVADLTTSQLRFVDKSFLHDSSFSARIGNAGSKEVPAGTPVSFYRIPPAGNGGSAAPELIKTVTLAQALPSGRYQDVQVEYSGDMQAFGELVVVANDAGAGIDSLTGIPLNASTNGGVVTEYSRGNNMARLAFGSGYQSFSLAGQLDKSSYGAGETIQITAVPMNLGSLSGSAVLQVRIEDSAGNVVSRFADQTVELDGSLLGGNNSKTITMPWSVGQAYPGQYRVVMQLLKNSMFGGSEVVATLERPFAVTSNAASTGLVSSSVQVDKTQYAAGDSVNVVARVQNTASNQPASARVLTVQLLDPDGMLIWSQTAAYDSLPASALVDKTWQVALSQAKAGTYQLRSILHAPDGSQADQFSSRSFSVLGATQSGVGIAGNIQGPAAVDVGSPISFSWSLSNKTASAISSVNTRIILVDAESGALIGSALYSGANSVAANAQSAVQQAQWNSAGQPEQRIMALLQVQLDKPGVSADERWRTLGSTAFKLTVPPLKISFDDVQKASKPVLIYYSCYDGWEDWISSWLLGSYDATCFNEREAQIKSYLQRLKVPYTMVKEPWQFRDRMHSGLYGQYWVLGGVEQLSPHGYKELRESAHLGDNLLTDNGIQSHQNSNLFALAGVRFRGRMQLSDGVISPQAANAGLPPLLTTPENPDLAATPLKTTTIRKGQSFTANWPLVLEPLSSYTQVSATFNGSKKLGLLLELSLDAGAKPNSYFQNLSTYPAVTMAPYGRGKPVALAFDLPASLNLANGGQTPPASSPVSLSQKRWDAALTELLLPRQSVARSSYVPNEPIDIPVTLDNQSNQPRIVQLDVELPAGAQWLGREGGTQSPPASTQAQAKVSYQVTLPANSKSTELIALRLPATAATHVVRTTVLNVVAGSAVPQALAQQENRYVVRTLDERFNLLKQSINSWNSSAGASWLELTALKTDFLLLDTHYRLGQWELALLQAGHVSDDLATMRSAQDSKITANRIELDEFMRGLQIRWYLQRNGQRPAP